MPIPRGWRDEITATCVSSREPGSSGCPEYVARGHNGAGWPTPVQYGVPAVRRRHGTAGRGPLDPAARPLRPAPPGSPGAARNDPWEAIPRRRHGMQSRHEGEIRRAGRSGHSGARRLERRAQPADAAAFFFTRTFQIEGGQAGDDLIGGGALGPSIGLGGQAIDIVVQLSQDDDQPPAFDVLGRGVQRDSRPEIFEDILEARQGQVRVLGQHPFAMRVQGFAREPQPSPDGFVTGREWKGVEARRPGVARTILQHAVARSRFASENRETGRGSEGRMSHA